MDIFDIRNQIQTEIFDYQTLISVLSGLASPRDKITDLLKEGAIIRVKKGLYVFGDKYRRYPYSTELLANLVYGPSYLSLDSGLSYYGLIPERVEALTSITTHRSRRFLTPVGLFTYRQVPLKAFQLGFVRKNADHDQSFLIAVPEKALADKIVSVRGVRIDSIKELMAFLEEDLRIDMASLRSFSPEKIDEYAMAYRSLRLRLFARLLKKIKKKASASTFRTADAPDGSLGRPRRAE